MDEDPLIARFAVACGVSGPLSLRVELADGGVLAEGLVSQPFAVVGRDDACEVTLADPEVNMRHAWLQAIGGRVFAVDLGRGLTWPGGARGSGWLDVGTPVRIGPFQLSLTSPASTQPTSYPPGYNPLASDNDVKSQLAVTLEFRNGRRGKDRWTVNRLLTLVGRSPDCKIHLNSEDISAYHCGIVSTPGGLWVVDLSGRGVVVNGDRMRVAPLAQGAELWVGRFLIGCQYQSPPAGSVPSLVESRIAPKPSSSNLAKSATPVSSNGQSPNSTSASDGARVASTPAASEVEDEVDFGADPESGDLPASHIMADAFRHKGPAPSGAMSNPILVSGSGPKPPPVLPESLLDSDGASELALAPLLRQMADLHGRAVAEFQQTQLLFGQLFSCVARENLATLQHELNRILDISAEIASLQSAVSKQSLEQAAQEREHQLNAPAPDTGEPRSADWVPPHTQTPLPEQQPLPRLPEGISALPHPAERLAALQQDRAARWQALLITVQSEMESPGGGVL